jgi:uncharacterized protein YceK
MKSSSSGSELMASAHCVRLCSIAACVAIFCLLLSGCATVISGTTQKLDVSSTPAGATLTVRPGEKRYVTPVQLVLSRRDGPYYLKFEREGYEPYRLLVTRTTNPWMWGNLLFSPLGMIIGNIVDVHSRAAFKLTPEEVHANLLSQGASAEHISDRAFRVVDRDGKELAVVTMSED